MFCLVYDHLQLRINALPVTIQSRSSSTESCCMFYVTWKPQYVLHVWKVRNERQIFIWLQSAISPRDAHTSYTLDLLHFLRGPLRIQIRMDEYCKLYKRLIRSVIYRKCVAGIMTKKQMGPLSEYRFNLDISELKHRFWMSWRVSRGVFMSFLSENMCQLELHCCLLNIYYLVFPSTGVLICTLLGVP